MTLAAYPTDQIPHQPAADGLAFDFPDLFGRSDMERGPARQRRKIGTGVVMVEQPFDFSNGQYEYFRAWLEHGINAGADWFTMPLFLGNDYSTTTTRLIKGQTKAKRSDGYWRVDAKLEITELPVISSGALTAIIGAAGSGLPAWPTELLANPLNDEFAHEQPDPLRRDDDGGGMLIDQARTVTVMPVTMSIAWPFAWSDFETFKGFVKHRLSWGAKWFTIPFFRGASLETTTVRFVKGSLRATREGPQWVVRGQLELRDLPPLSLAAAEVLL